MENNDYYVFSIDSPQGLSKISEEDLINMIRETCINNTIKNNEERKMYDEDFINTLKQPRDTNAVKNKEVNKSMTPKKETPKVMKSDVKTYEEWYLPMAGFTKQNISVGYEHKVKAITVSATMSPELGKLFEERFRNVYYEKQLEFVPTNMKATLGSDGILCIVYKEPISQEYIPIEVM